MLLQVFYPIRSSRLLMEQLDYILLFRWFVGLSMDDKVWDRPVLSKNQARFPCSALAAAFFGRIKAPAATAGLLSDENFTVDGTLIEAWDSLKSFCPKDAPLPSGRVGLNPEVDFHGARRLNQTHASTADPEARLFRQGKGKEAKRGFIMLVLMENRHGPLPTPRLLAPTGSAGRDAAERPFGDFPGRQRLTVGGDKAYDTQEFVQSWRVLHVLPHMAQNCKGRNSNIDRRTIRHPGYAISLRRRKQVEEIFGWMKTVGNLIKTRHRGTERVG